MIRKVYLSLLLLTMIEVYSYAQDSIHFYGFAGEPSDSLFYFYNDNTSDSVLVKIDDMGLYNLALAPPSDAYKISFYFKSMQMCEQALLISNLKAYLTNTQATRIRNDVAVINGFACVRMECMDEEKSPFMGYWKSETEMAITFDCYYKRDIYRGDDKFVEEGEWSLEPNKAIVLAPQYLKNDQLGTYELFTNQIRLKIAGDMLMNENDNKTYIKISE